MNIAFRDFDDALGPAAGRYFGDGYRHVGHQLSDLHFSDATAPGNTLSAVAQLDYPQKWSRKNDRELVPHVSSIDTVALATAVVSEVISRTRALSPQEAARTWLSRVNVSAGSQPEEDLNHVPVAATITEVRAHTDHSVSTTAKFTVGGLRGSLTLEHPAGNPSPISAEQTPIDSNIGPTAFYLGGYKRHSLSASHLTVDRDTETITGRGHLDITAGTSTGTDSAYLESVSSIDIILGAAQLAQILLYALDDIDRTATNTLWMRKLELTATSPHRGPVDSFPMTVAMRRASLITRGEATWRSADMTVSGFGGISGSCLLAHELPMVGAR